MYNELVLVIKNDKVDEVDRKHARLLLSQLKTAGGRHFMRKEITYFLEDMVEKYELGKTIVESIFLKK